MLNEPPKIEYIDLYKIKPNDYNVNVMDRETLRQLAFDMGNYEESILRINPIIVRKLSPEESKEWRESQEKLPFE